MRETHHDNELLLRFQRSRDREALEEFVRRTSPELWRFASAKARSVSEVEDLVQMTYLQVLESVDVYDATRDALPWLIGILMNRVREHWRVRRHTATPEEATPHDHSPGPLEFAQKRETEWFLADAVGRLGSPYREVLSLYLHDELEPNEIASRLSRSSSTVRTQLSRGISRLRDVLPPGIAISAAAMLSLQGRIVAAATERAAPPAEAAVMTAARSALRPRLIALAGVGLALAVTWFAIDGLGADQPAAIDSVADATGAPDPVAPQPEDEVAAGTAAVERVEDPSEPVPPTGELSIQVFSKGQPLPNVMIQIVPSPVSAASPAELYRTGLVRQRRTGEDGFVVFPGVPHGELQIWMDNGFSRVSGPYAGESEPMPIHATSHLRLMGTVTDAGGDPVAGASIRVCGAALGRRVPGVEITTTGADGSYTADLVNLWGAPRFWAEADGFVTSHTRSSLVDGQWLRNFVLQAGGLPLRVTLVDADGQPVPHALVGVFPPLDPDREDWQIHPEGGVRPASFAVADASGVAEVGGLPAGLATILCSAPGFPPVSREIDPSREPEATVVLGEGATVRGQISFPAGPRPVEVTVRIGPRNVSGDVQLAASKLVRPDAEGRFEVRDLPHGELVGHVCVETGHIAAVERLIGTAGQVLRWDPKLPAGRVISGRIVDEHGNGVTEALVSMSPVGVDQTLSNNARSVLVEADGTFRFDNVALGAYRLTSEQSRFWEYGHPCGAVWKEPVAAGTTGVKLHYPSELRELAHVRGRIVSSHPQVSDQAVMAFRRPGIRKHRFRGMDKEGRVVFGPVAPGELDIAVILVEYGGYYLGRHTQHPGEDLDLGDVEVPDPVEVRVMLQGPGSGSQEIEVVARDAALFMHVEFETDGRSARAELFPGSWQLRIRGADTALQTLDLELRPDEDRVIEVDLEPAPTLELELECASTNNPGVVVYSISDAEGRVVWEETVFVDIGDGARRSIGLAPGVYGYRAIGTAMQTEGTFEMPMSDALRVLVY